MEPTQQQINELEKYLDALQCYSIVGEFRKKTYINQETKKFEDYLDFYIWKADTPENQVGIAHCCMVKPDTAIVAVMCVLAVLTNSHYQEINERINVLNDGCHYEYDFINLKYRMRRNGLIE